MWPPTLTTAAMRSTGLFEGGGVARSGVQGSDASKGQWQWEVEKYLPRCSSLFEFLLKQGPRETVPAFSKSRTEQRTSCPGRSQIKSRKHPVLYQHQYFWPMHVPKNHWDLRCYAHIFYRGTLLARACPEIVP